MSYDVSSLEQEIERLRIMALMDSAEAVAAWAQFRFGEAVESAERSARLFAAADRLEAGGDDG